MSARDADATGREPDRARDAEPPSWVTLTADERVLWEGHPSTYRIAGPLAAAAVVVVVGAVVGAVAGGFAWVGFVLAVLGLGAAAATWIRHRSTTYVVTTEEVYRKTGVFSREVVNLRLDRVQNTGYTQSFAARLLSYGDVRIDTAGTGAAEIVFEDVPNPERVLGVLAEQLDGRS